MGYPYLVQVNKPKGGHYRKILTMDSLCQVRCHLERKNSLNISKLNCAASWSYQKNCSTLHARNINIRESIALNITLHNDFLSEWIP